MESYMRWKSFVDQEHDDLISVLSKKEYPLMCL